MSDKPAYLVMDLESVVDGRLVLIVQTTENLHILQCEKLDPHGWTLAIR